MKTRNLLITAVLAGGGVIGGAAVVSGNVLAQPESSPTVEVVDLTGDSVYRCSYTAAQMVGTLGEASYVEVAADTAASSAESSESSESSEATQVGDSSDDGQTDTVQLGENGEQTVPVLEGSPTECSQLLASLQQG